MFFEKGNTAEDVRPSSSWIAQDTADDWASKLISSATLKIQAINRTQ